jgi:hypothetical protein
MRTEFLLQFKFAHCVAALRTLMVPTALLALATTPVWLPAQAPSDPAAAQLPAASAQKPAHFHKRPTPAHVAVTPDPDIQAPVTPPVPEKPNWPAFDQPLEASVVWDSHGLKVDATNSSLQQILKDVSTATGVKIDGVTSDQRVFGIYGPGQARDVLSQLLQGSGYNVIMIGDQGEGTPRQILLSMRQSGAASATPKANQTNNEDEEDEPPAPQEPEPPVRPAFPPGVPPRSPQQIMQEMQQRQQQIQQQNQPQQPNPPQPQQPQN